MDSDAYATVTLYVLALVIEEMYPDQPMMS